ncbi:hypothetical protein SAMN02910369_00050 [Lachnospiraceae bacterium NE2001]|nr:hypothetical protein SAMN02910369_00050 [Lachnospiraceae bacterium NE2001]
MAELSSVIYSPIGRGIIFVALALLLLEIELSILSIRQRRTFDTISLIWGIFFFTCLLDIIYVPWFAGKERTEWNWIVSLLMRLPWLVVIGIEILTLTVVIIRARIIYKYRKDRITRSSIKEAMDKLPAGILILGNDESVILSNLKMNEYVRNLTGNRLRNGKEFWDYVTENGEKKGDRYILQSGGPDSQDTEDSSASETHKNRNMYISFDKDQLLIRENCYDEIKAFDITEQALIMKELEAKNARLRDVQYRMKAYQVRASDMFMDQELLDARVAVHDGLGALLLQSRSYLDGHMDDEEELLTSLKYTNGFLLSESEAIDEERDHYLEGLRMAEGVGVKVTVEGDDLLERRVYEESKRRNLHAEEDERDEPESLKFELDTASKTQVRNLLGQAIGECAANTIKHAGGNEVKVLIERLDSTTFIEITNNGDPPKETIKETGGLLSLRHMVDNLKGEMYIRSEPEFRLKIILRDDVLEADK